MQHIDYIVNLLKDYLSENLAEEQEQEINQLFGKYPGLKSVVDEMTDEKGLHQALEAYEELYGDEEQSREEYVLENILSRVRTLESTSLGKTRRKRLLMYIATAAALVGVILFFTGILLKQRSVEVRYTAVDSISFEPGNNRALLTLSNGQQVNLSDGQAGIIIGDEVKYDDGTPLLEGDAVPEHTMLTLTTPRGGQYRVTLSDGTKVWLNADSRLHYPQRFAKNNRNVQLEGEAYFEVAHRPEAPFVVTTDKEKVEVLGTHFNINSYQADRSSTVALLEGKVRVSVGEKLTKVLRPGEQSIVENGNMSIQTVNVEESVAWKNGEFMFNNETLEMVMHKISRWYDLDISVAPALKNVKIWGSVSRYENFNQVLKVIKMTDERIHFEVEGRRVKLVK